MNAKHPATPTRLVLLAILAAITCLPACRDFRASGLRIEDHHVLRSRPASAGGGELLDDELRRGWVDVTTSDLVELRTALSSELGMSIDLDIDVEGELPGQADLFAAGDVTSYDPATGSFSTAAEVLTAAFATLDIGGLLDDLQAACGNALLRPSLSGDACQPFNFDVGFDPNPIDGITFRVDPASIQAQWLPPEPFYNERAINKSVGDNPTGGGCSEDSDCKFGLSCQAGVCSCDAANPCPFAFSCNETTNRCQYDDVVCTEDRDCAIHPDIGLSEARCGSRGLCERRSVFTFAADRSQEHPVLAIDVTFEVTDTDEDDATAFTFLPVQIQRWTTRFRIQAVPCTDASCTNVPRVFEEFRSASEAGDLERNNHGLAFSVEAEHLGHDVEFLPVGALCWLTAGSLCAVLEVEGRDGLDRGFLQIEASIARLFRALLNVPTSSRYVDSDAAELLLLNEAVFPGFGFGAAPLTRIDLHHSSFAADGSEPVLAADGALTNGLVDALSTGGEVALLAFEAANLRALCGPDPRGGVGGQCAADPALPGCASVCQACVGTSFSACDFSGEVFTVARPTGPVGNTLLIPAAPSLAAGLQAIYGLGTTVRGWLGNVLARLEPTLARFTDVAWCPAGTRSARCPISPRDGGDRVVLHFHPDSDLDGTPDVFDLCPDDVTPGGVDEDWDHDGHGNACDLCPLNAGPNTDRDGDGIGDACDCDLDGDSCNQSAIGNPFSPPEGEAGDPVRFCSRSGTIFDARPFYSDGGVDAEGDGQTDDCDPDDDNDGIHDDGAGDGIDTYTPCRGGNNFGCDDNCRTDANASQADRNDDGLGNACDPICNESSPGFLCSPEVFERHERFDVGDGFAAGLDPICPSCLLRVRCLEPAGGAGGPGFGFGCPGEGLDVTFADGIQLDLASLLGQFAYSRLAAAQLFPDLDGDGFAELGLALSGFESFQGASRLMVLSSQEPGGVLLNLTLPIELNEIGGLSVVGSSVFVSAFESIKQRGQVLEIDLHTGAVLRSFRGGGGGGDGDGEGFGASVFADAHRVFVGAPFANGGAGRVLIMDRCSGETLDVIEGPAPGTFLGGGPIQTFSRAVGEFVAFGAPQAEGGDGELLIYRLDPVELVARVQGGKGSALGASLVTLPGLSDDGSTQGWVGAPGFDLGRGAVFRIDGSLELGPIVDRGAKKTDAFGTQLLLGDGTLHVSAGGASLDGQSVGAFVSYRLDDVLRPKAPFGAFAEPGVCQAPGDVIDFETKLLPAGVQLVQDTLDSPFGQSDSVELRESAPPASYFPAAINPTRALQITEAGARFEFAGRVVRALTLDFIDLGSLRNFEVNGLGRKILESPQQLADIDPRAFPGFRVSVVSQPVTGGQLGRLKVIAEPGAKIDSLLIAGQELAIDDVVLEEDLGVEDAGPNTGDANGDDVADSLQEHVASLPDLVGADYVSIEVGPGIAGACGRIEGVAVRSEEQMGALDPAFDYPFGLFDFALPCTSARVHVLLWGLDTTSAGAIYRKYGPTVPGDPATRAYYDLPFQTSTRSIAGRDVAVLSFDLLDGQPGDDSGFDGWIFDPGAPALAPPPDADADGIPDATDNCVDTPNPDQTDINAGQDDDTSQPGIQHYGDACDVDLDNDGTVGVSDFFGFVRVCFNANVQAVPKCAPADLDGDGSVGAADFFGRLRPALGTSPGPGVTEGP